MDTYGQQAARGSLGEITVTAVMSGPGGAVLRVPAFWDGGQTLARATDGGDAGHVAGAHRVQRCERHRACMASRPSLEVGPADTQSGNPLYRHGAVRIAAVGSTSSMPMARPSTGWRDTWWMLMSERVSWPEGFKRLTARRAEQGFTVVQTVVGFQPDTTPFDGRDANAGGSPWMPGYQHINPGFFQACDRRLAHLVESGIVPCILGGWGYHMLFMGKERMISHWRYLVARYAAWPVIWCLAGEAAMAYYLSKDHAAIRRKLAAAWPDVARAVRAERPVAAAADDCIAGGIRGMTRPTRARSTST